MFEKELLRRPRTTIVTTKGDAESIITLCLSLSWRQFQHQADVFGHRSAHQSVHNVLAELQAVVAVDGVGQTDNHFKVIHVDVPVVVIGEQAK